MQSKPRDHDILQNIKDLKKLKKDAPKKSEARREINKTIRSLKKILALLGVREVISPEKQNLIEAIYIYRPEY